MEFPKPLTHKEAMPSPTVKRYAARYRRGVWYVTVNLQPLRHFVCHTEGPFSWGDESAGSADLALSILWNHVHKRGNFGLVTEISVEVEGRTVWSDTQGIPAFTHYQQFKREVVSRWAKEKPWEITTEEIALWLARQEERNYETL